MSDSHPLIIIGTGLAGYSLAREFRKLNPDKALVMISRDDGHSYSKPMLSTGFTKGKDADALSMGDPGKMAEQLKATIRTHTTVDRIDTANKVLEIGEERLHYDQLVLATGASVNRLNFPGSDHPKVMSINDLMDYRAFRKQLGENQHVAIMGAGLIGCEYANDLLNGGHQVSVIDPSTSALSGLIPEPAGKAVVAGLSDAGASFYLGQYVQSVRDTGKSLELTLNDGALLEADIVVSAVGLKPDLGLAKASGIDCSRGIVTNRLLQTSAPDVFALGDAAEVDGHVLLYVLPLMACARALAKTLNATPTQVSYGVMPVATKTPACPVIVCPPLSREGQWQFEQDGLNVKGIFHDSTGEASGFVLTGDYISEKQQLAKMLKGIHA